MKQWTRGFTLIEVLIVVLIVAILSAIAVPAYQKAVLKSRFSSLMPTAKAIRDGQEMYYMTNGRYADTVSKLDVTATNNDDMPLTVSDDMDYAYTMATHPNIKNNLIMYQKHSANFPGEVHCEALKGNSQAEWLCETGLKAIRNLGENITPNYTTYVLEGTGMGIPYWAKDIDCNKAISMGISCQAIRNAYGAGRQMCINGVCRTIYENEDGGYRSITCQVNDENVCTGMWHMATYDANGRILSKRECNANAVTEDGGCSRYRESYDYIYDINGIDKAQRYCTAVDKNGKCTQYNAYQGFDWIYDKDGNLLVQRGCGGLATDGVTCATYDNSNSYNNVYDDQGNLRYEFQCQAVLASNTSKCASYTSYGNYENTYDDQGNLIARRQCKTVYNDKCTSYYDGTSFNIYTGGNKTKTRSCQTLDTNGITCLTYKTNGGTDYTYDAKGQVLYYRSCYSSSAENGNCTSYGGGVRYQYDAKGNVTAEWQIDKYGSPQYGYSTSYRYGYDAAGNQTSKLTCRYSNTMPASCKEYTKGEVYMYDDHNNRIGYKYCTGSNLNTSTGQCIAYDGGTTTGTNTGDSSYITHWY